MSSVDHAENPTSFGCTFGCGNAYDFVVVNVRDNSTEMLCAPCFCTLASNMIEAAVNPDNPTVVAAMALRQSIAADQVPGPTGRRGRRNPPATSHDPDLFAAYDPSADEDEEDGEVT